MAAAATALIGAMITGPPASGAGTSAEDCLRSPHMVRLSGTYRREVRYPAVLAGTTFDARNARFTAYPESSLYPFSIGKRNAAAGSCVVGGVVVGGQSRALGWDQMKGAYDGDGLRLSASGGAVVDGLRVDNLEDGVAPRGTESRYPKDGDGFVMRNLYFRYIRDDCVENDDIAGGVITDSLFDGCNTGVSERPSEGSRQSKYRAPRGETLTLDGVLLRLQAMPGPRGSRAGGGVGHGQLFKWSPVANSLVVKRSVFLVERVPNSTSSFPFPKGTVTEDVTIVWLGKGSFHWRVPEGTTVTRDRSAWDVPKAAWLARHGCVAFTACSRITAPLPLPSAAHSDSPSALPAGRAGGGPALPSRAVPLAALPRVPLILAIVALAGTVGLFVVVKTSPQIARGYGLTGEEAA
jgi:hypothetical protein